MPVNYKCWIGKEECFTYEVATLFDLLSEKIVNKLVNLSLCSGPQDNYQWIGDEHLLECEDPSFPSEGGHISLQTSGTTGQPKVVWKNCAQALTLKKGRGSPEDIWLLTYSPLRWAGLSVMLHVINTYSTLTIPFSLEPEDLLGRCQADWQPVTHLSLTPSLFKKLLLFNPAAFNGNQIKQVTFGGEYATQTILNQARTIFPQARVSHIYATTELGDIWSCSDGQEGFPISKLNEEYQLSPTGELIVKGQETQDVWRIDKDRLYFVGRESEIIKVGGEKVSLLEVENIITQLPGIDQCRTYAIPNAILGQVVGLEYVGSLTTKEIRQQLVGRLPKFMMPVVLQQVTSLSLTIAGKISRTR